jgi:hypothetical protein
MMPGQQDPSGISHRQGSLRQRQGSLGKGPADQTYNSSADNERGSLLYLDSIRIQEMQEAPFDEKLSLISLLIDALNRSFAACAREKAVQELIMKTMNTVRGVLKNSSGSLERARSQTLASETIRKETEKILVELQKKKDAGIPISREEERTRRIACRDMNRFASSIRFRDLKEEQSPRAQYGMIMEWFSKREADRQAGVRAAGQELTNAFRFLSRVYGEGQEMVLFLTELSAGYHSLRFLNEYGNESYFRLNRMLLLQDRTDALRDQVLHLMN